MKCRKTILFWLLISSVFLSIGQAKPTDRGIYPKRTIPPTADDKNTVEMILCYSGSIEGDSGGTKFLVALPQTIANKQKILSTECTPKPSRKFERNGNSYAEFMFDHSEKQFSVLVNVKAELYRFDLSTAKKKGSKDIPKEDESQLASQMDKSVFK